MSAIQKLKFGTAAVAPVVPSVSLVSRSADWLMAGGASLLVLVLMMVMLRSDSPDGRMAWSVFQLSFLVNFPHFLLSYQLLYWDFGSKIFKEPRYFWAAVVVPLAISLALIMGFVWKSPQTLAYCTNAMFFFVGWHYVKQIFGGVVVFNSLENFFYNHSERWILKLNLYSLWAVSFIVPNLGERSHVRDGIYYPSLDLPAWTLKVAYFFLAATFAAVVAMTVYKWVREGRWPARSAVICYLSIYAWFLPALRHPMFMHLVPFFHSLQYLIFVYAFRRNKVASTTEVTRSPDARLKWLTNLWGYLAVSVAIGAIAMYFLPKALDRQQWLDGELFGPMPFYFAFVLFINVHHYFIDNVLWRGDNAEMREYLFQATKPGR